MTTAVTAAGKDKDLTQGQRFAPGPNVTSLYYAKEHMTIIYIANLLGKNNVNVKDLDKIQEYIVKREFDDKMQIWLDFRSIISINNRALKQIVNNNITKKIRFHAVTGFMPSMDKKFRGWAKIENS